MNEPTFETRFWNRRKKPVTVWERGNVLLDLAPNAIAGVESISPLSTYALWDEVIFEEGDQVNLHERPGWVEPDRGRWVIELVNKDGHDIEKRTIAGSIVPVPKKIPIFVAVPAEAPEAKFKKIIIQRKLVRVRSEQFAGYFTKEWQIVDERIERDAGELKEIASVLEKSKT